MITDKVRDILVQAYLDNVPQVQGMLKNDEGFCALGVLYEYLVSRGLCVWYRKDDFFYYNVLRADGTTIEDESELREHFELTSADLLSISRMNDSADKPTFLDIARKVGIKEEVIPNGPGQADQGTGS